MHEDWTSGIHGRTQQDVKDQFLCSCMCVKIKKCYREDINKKIFFLGKLNYRVN